MRAPVLA